MLKIIPKIIYVNTDIDKAQILKDNNNKSGIYRWVNKTNNKSYVGSSINLISRFYRYYNIKHLVASKRLIDKALLKYGYSNFRLEILEYCDIDILLVREQYYIDKLKPEYNIAPIAGSTLGFKHSQETLNYFKNDRKFSEEAKKKLSKAATGRVLASSVGKKILASRLGSKVSIETRSKISASTSALIGIPVIIKNIQTNIETEYINLTEAAKAINVSRTAVKKALYTGNLLQKKYYVKKI